MVRGSPQKRKPGLEISTFSLGLPGKRENRRPPSAFLPATPSCIYSRRPLPESPDLEKGPHSVLFRASLAGRPSVRGQLSQGDPTRRGQAEHEAAQAHTRRWCAFFLLRRTHLPTCPPHPHPLLAPLFESAFPDVVVLDFNINTSLFWLPLGPHTTSFRALNTVVIYSRHPARWPPEDGPHLSEAFPESSLTQGNSSSTTDPLPWLGPPPQVCLRPSEPLPLPSSTLAHVV